MAINLKSIFSRLIHLPKLQHCMQGAPPGILHAQNVKYLVIVYNSLMAIQGLTLSNIHFADMNQFERRQHREYVEAVVPSPSVRSSSTLMRNIFHCRPTELAKIPDFDCVDDVVVDVCMQVMKARQENWQIHILDTASLKMVLLLARKPL